MNGCDTCRLFHIYFDIADELDGGLALEELNVIAVGEARKATEHWELPWPPDLAVAEELQNDFLGFRYEGNHNPFSERVG
jgi:hypothetical protein